MRLRLTGLDDPAARSLVFGCWSEICERYSIAVPCGEAEALPSGSFAPPDGADRLGYPEVWLETGTAQPEAVRLYEGAGWTPIPRYGEYKAEPDSRCYRKVRTAQGSACLSGPVQQCSEKPTERRSACEQTTPGRTGRHPAQG